MNKLLLKFCYLTLIALSIILAQSCSEDAKSLEGAEELSQTEVRTILETDEMVSVADNALAELFAQNSVSGKSAKSNECYTATYSETGFVATFNNCVLNGTENVNGTLTVTYDEGNEGLSYSATYEDFYVGNIKINGTRSFTNSAEQDQNTITFTVESNITVEMEDESVVSETGSKTFGFTFGGDLANSTFSLSGSWTVQANGNTYSIETLSALQGTLSCEYLTTGSMVVTKNGLAITVDFGNGDCDDLATLIYPNGATEEITL